MYTPPDPTFRVDLSGFSDNRKNEVYAKQWDSEVEDKTGWAYLKHPDYFTWDEQAAILNSTASGRANRAVQEEEGMEIGLNSGTAIQRLVSMVLVSWHVPTIKNDALGEPGGRPAPLPKDDPTVWKKVRPGVIKALEDAFRKAQEDYENSPN